MLLSLHLLEGVMLEKDGIFRSYIDALRLEQVVALCTVYFVTLDCDRTDLFGMAYHIVGRLSM